LSISRHILDEKTQKYVQIDRKALDIYVYTDRYYIIYIYLDILKIRRITNYEKMDKLSGAVPDIIRIGLGR
jgi:hypothetical protein